MLAVFHPDQLLHEPRHFLVNGVLADNPETPERARVFLDALKGAGISVETPALDGAQRALASVHAPDYLDFLANGYARWRDELSGPPEIVPKIHPAGAGLSRTGDIEGLAGYYQLDAAVPIGRNTWRSILACAATTFHAATHVARGLASTAYALCRPGGHHAGRATAMGFCYLNNAAIAAQVLRTLFTRVAVVDIDAHHGNGTEQIFETRDDVVTVSIHVDPQRFYPFYWGHASERGRDAGRGFNRNIVLPRGSGETEWLAALESALETVECAAPGALVISLGLDGHRDDPLGGFDLDAASFAAAARRLRGLDLPTVIVQEGGYLHDESAKTLQAFLDTYRGC